MTIALLGSGKSILLPRLSTYDPSCTHFDVSLLAGWKVTRSRRFKPWTSKQYLRFRFDVWKANLAITLGHASDVYSLEFSPDSKTLASGGFDFTVRIWDPLLAQELAELSGHQGTVFDVSFSRDGHVLASASGHRPGAATTSALGAAAGPGGGHSEPVRAAVRDRPGDLCPLGVAARAVARVVSPGSGQRRPVSGRSSLVGRSATG